MWPHRASAFVRAPTWWRTSDRAGTDRDHDKNIPQWRAGPPPPVIANRHVHAMLSPPWATLARANAGRAVPLRSARRKSRGTRFATSIARQSFRCRRRNLTQPLPTRATVVVTSLAARQDAPDDASSPRTALVAPATDVQPPEVRALPRRQNRHNRKAPKELHP